MADEESVSDDSEHGQDADPVEAEPPEPDPRLVEWVTRDKEGEQKVPRSGNRK